MVYVLVFILGSIIGSFLNVCIYRLPRSESIISPWSHCPGCKTPLGWYDNIPFISYIALKGRCRVCGMGISLRYILVEALTALIFIIFYKEFGLGIRFWIYSGLLSSLIAISFIDAEFQIIPDEITILGIILGLVFSFFFPLLHNVSTHLSGFLNSLVGVFIGGVSIYITGLIGNVVFKKESMGGGDVKLLAMVGAFLGWKIALLTFFIAPLFGSIIGIVLKIKKKAEVIPYGPHLSLATFLALLWGEKILNWIFFIR